jgi:hypothetical protein
VKSNQLYILTTALLILISDIAFSNKYIVPQIPINSNYNIDVEISPEKKMIKGKEIIVFTNTGNFSLETLAFDWEITETSEFEISLQGNLLTLLNANDNNTVTSPLLYSLESPIKPGQKVQIQIKFSSMNLIKNSDKVELQNWYPQLWWDGIDTFNSFKIKLVYPEEYALAISARLNKKTGYYENQGVRSCGVCLYKNYLIVQKEVDDVLITSIHTEKGTECAKLCLETATDAVKFYKDWLGFYPFKFLYIIPGATEPWGGYPFASGIVVIHGQEKFDKKPLVHWKWITAHEIGHQYWGEYVFDEYHSWLWIGLGVYADREYSIHRNLGLKKHTGMMNKYIKGVTKHFDTTADLTPSQIRKADFDYNNVVKHGKGFSIISALELVLGKDRFVQIYKRCLDDYAGKYLGYRDFWKICEKESGENLAWFFEQWVQSNKYLSYSIISQNSDLHEDGFISDLAIKCNGTLKMPVPVKAIFKDNSYQVKFTNRLLTINNLHFRSESKLKAILLDPDKQLAMITDSLFLLHEEIKDNIKKLSWRDEGKRALDLFLQAQKNSLLDFKSWYKLGLVLFYSRKDAEVFISFRKAHEIDTDDFVTAVWLGHMNDLKGNRKEALKYYNKALENDTGRTIRYDQFGLRINRIYVEERLNTPFTFE